MEVKNLIEYMEIVCGKIMSYPLESNHTDIKYLSQMNSSPIHLAYNSGVHLRVIGFGYSSMKIRGE